MAFTFHQLLVFEAKFVSVTVVGNVSLRSYSFNLEVSLHFSHYCFFFALASALHLD